MKRFHAVRRLFTLTAALAAATLLAAVPALAAPRLAAIFGDGMVLQRDKPVHIWGWAEPGEALQAEFRGETLSAQAGPDGRFSLRFKPAPAGGPHTLRVAGQGSAQLQDLLMGDVWLASGQSNMAWPVKDSADAAREIAAADFAQIRHFTVARRASLQPQADVTPARWQAARPEAVGEFSAVAYFFARQVHRETGVPIGIVNASWGGTHIETWSGAHAVQADPALAPMVARMPKDAAAYQAGRLKQQRAVIAAWQGPPRAGDAKPEAWSAPELDDRHWRSLAVPKAWEEQGLAGFDGYVWYRRVVTLSEAQAAAAAELHLGAIDDCDETWLNGQRLGGNCEWDQPRRYALPPGALRAGRNVIAVRVSDTGGGGGFWGDAKVPRLETAAGSLSLTGAWRARVEAPLARAEPTANDLPMLAFNGMVHPLIGLPIRGALWYQGESNVPRAARYAKAFQAMITDWRRLWGQGDFPFYFVQLASYLPLADNTLKGSTWAELRDAQRQALVLPNTGMAVAIDIGDANDIHPRNKQEIGRRLALLALNRDYGKPQRDSAPLLRSVSPQGEKLVLGFDGAGDLVVRGGGELRGFAVAGSQGVFHPARARIDGRRVVLSSASVPRPLAVRYGWVDNPEEANLTGAGGLPVGPFRSDKAPLLSERGRFTP
jgi:sialate O-acetylesterase